MILHLRNGYPYPYPDNLTEAEQESISMSAAGNELEIHGVAHFEWLHTVTVEFTDDEALERAARLTGWGDWDYRVLEAPTSSGDGYDHPAIVVGGMAYCGFILREGG